ncbi:MAG: hypothetical protein U1F45_14015 [Burkholderiales bacterium]
MPESNLGRKAVALGHRQGYAKGMQRGLSKGLREGVAEGRRKGVLEGMQRVLLRQLKLRFGPVPAALRVRIERVTDARVLDRIAAGLAQGDDLMQLGRLVLRGGAAPKRKARRSRALPEGPASAVNPRRPRRMKPVRGLY